MILINWQIDQHSIQIMHFVLRIVLNTGAKCLGPIGWVDFLFDKLALPPTGRLCNCKLGHDAWRWLCGLEVQNTTAKREHNRKRRKHNRKLEKQHVNQSGSGTFAPEAKHALPSALPETKYEEGEDEKHERRKHVDYHVIFVSCIKIFAG